MNDKKIIKALVVDDEKAIRDFLDRFLSLNGIKVEAVEDDLKAIAVAQKEEFDLIFLEIRISRVDSFKLLKDLRNINPQTRYVLMSGSVVVDDLPKEAKQDDVIGVIEKPFKIKEIMSQLNTIRHLKKD